MKFSTVIALLLLANLLASTHSFAAPREVLRQEDRFPIAGGSATLTRLDALPFVESDYTKRFKFDTSMNPKLKELRERVEHFHVDRVESRRDYSLRMFSGMAMGNEPRALTLMRCSAILW